MSGFIIAAEEFPISKRANSTLRDVGPDQGGIAAKVAGATECALVQHHPVALDASAARSPKADPLLGNFTPTGSDDSRVSPKLGVVFKPAEQARLFFNYAQGFKAPSPSQANNAFANPIQNYRSIPNPDLKAETSEAFEGGPGG